MTAALLAVEIGPSEIITAIGSCAVTAGILIGAFDKRRKDISQTWKDLYEAKAQEVVDLTGRLASVEAKVDLLQSDFIEQLAEGITRGVSASIVRAIREERESKP